MSLTLKVTHILQMSLYFVSKGFHRACGCVSVSFDDSISDAKELTYAASLCYRAYGSAKEDSPLCDVPGFETARMKLLRHVSFVDCPVSSCISLLFSLYLPLSFQINGAAPEFVISFVYSCPGFIPEIDRKCNVYAFLPTI